MMFKISFRSEFYMETELTRESLALDVNKNFRYASLFYRRMGTVNTSFLRLSQTVDRMCNGIVYISLSGLKLFLLKRKREHF